MDRQIAIARVAVVAAFTGEDSGSAYLTRRSAASRTTRAGEPAAAR